MADPEGNEFCLYLMAAGMSNDAEPAPPDAGARPPQRWCRRALRARRRGAARGAFGASGSNCTMAKARLMRSTRSLFSSLSHSL